MKEVWCTGVPVAISTSVKSVEASDHPSTPMVSSLPRPNPPSLHDRRAAGAEAQRLRGALVSTASSSSKCRNVFFTTTGKEPCHRSLPWICHCPGGGVSAVNLAVPTAIF